jgi:hypothetical protein
MLAKAVEYLLSLVSKFSALLSVIFVFLAAVTWTAGQAAIMFVAPIVIYSLAGCSILAAGGAALTCTEWFRLKRAELRRDRTMATNEASRDTLETERARMRLTAEGRLLAATVRQMEAGLIHAGQLGEGVKFSSFPAAVVKHIENAVPLLEAPAPKTLPARVDLPQLMSDRPSLNNLILGVTYDDQIVTGSLKSLTHMAIAGVTRFGKSIFIQQLLYQIAAAKENVTLYLADLGGTTFVDFGLPYASTLAETEAMIYDVMSEAERRKGLYEATGRGIRSLDIYNEVTGDNLPWVVMIIDEALYLMEKSKAVKENLEIAVSWAAKYGITAVIVSQDWKSNVVQTSTRNNFSSRFQFLAEDRAQANILVKGCEADRIENKGRCFARLPGQNKITELQTPYISEAQIAAIAPHIRHNSPAANGAVTPVTAAPPLTFVVGPEPAPEPGRPNDDEMTVIMRFQELRDGDKFSWRKATEYCFGEGKFGKGYNQKLRRILDEYGIDYSDTSASKNE